MFELFDLPGAGKLISSGSVIDTMSEGKMSLEVRLMSKIYGLSTDDIRVVHRFALG